MLLNGEPKIVLNLYAGFKSGYLATEPNVILTGLSHYQRRLEEQYHKWNEQAIFEGKPLSEDDLREALEALQAATQIAKVAINMAQELQTVLFEVSEKEA